MEVHLVSNYTELLDYVQIACIISNSGGKATCKVIRI